MLALKISLLFSAGGTGGEDTPLRKRGRGIGRSGILGYRVLLFLHKKISQVEVSL
jgi:hypothetical protein